MFKKLIQQKLKDYKIYIHKNIYYTLSCLQLYFGYFMKKFNFFSFFCYSLNFYEKLVTKFRNDFSKLSNIN